ncbi:hypothetical protein [Brevibacillus daliensis]|nr:hypothetical protein [Brevibacillus daliensis]
MWSFNERKDANHLQMDSHISKTISHSVKISNPAVDILPAGLLD